MPCQEPAPPSSPLLSVSLSRESPSHSLRVQPQGTAIAGAGPEVAVLRLLQATSPGRGGSGRAGGAVPAAELLRVAGPPRAEAALVTPAEAGGSAPSCGERAGPGGAGAGLGQASRADPGGTRERAVGRALGAAGTRGRHTSEEVTPLPPNHCPPARAWFNPQRMWCVASSARNSKLSEAHPHSWNCESAHFAGRTRGFRLRLAGGLGWFGRDLQPDADL